MLPAMFARLFSGETLKARAMKGAVVALGGFGAAQAIRLASNLIMTRLIAPDAFGLMGVTVALHVWIGMMSDLGLNASIIRSKHGEDPEYLAMARTLQLARAALVASMLVIAALSLPALAAAGYLREGSVYADPRLPAFLYAIAFSMMIAGFSAMRVALHNRKLNLAPVIRLELAAQVIALVSMATAAKLGLGVYSLAFGGIVSEAVKTIGSYVALKGPPARFGFHREHFREIFTFGKWLIVASTFGFLAQRGDQVIFGWLFDLRNFSLYSIATIWIVTAVTVIETVQRRIATPALAELHRERPHDLTRVYRRIRLIYDAGVFALFLGVVFLSDFFIKFLYTDDYHGVAHYMKLLALLLLLIPYRLLNNVVLTAGDSRSFTLLTVIPGAALIAGTPAVYHFFGADAAIAFATTTPIFALPFNWKFASKYVRIDYPRESVMAIVTVIAAILLLRFV
jgi:O-antigen/teichoic acid export membrane protein